MPISNLIEPAAQLARGDGFDAQRTPQGVVLRFQVLRAPGAALGLLLFAVICGLMPAIGLSALLPLDSANASALVSLALIGGFAAPFIFASIVFALLAIYLLANSLRVEVTAAGVSTERRVLGYVTKRCALARADIADIEPRISARYQNIFSATPRYTVIAKHGSGRSNDVVLAEDVFGQAQMIDIHTLICTTLNIK